MSFFKYPCASFSLLLMFLATSISAQAQVTVTLDTTKDSYVRPNDGNNGNSNNLVVTNRGEGDSSTRTSWIGFDLSQPAIAGEFVQSAQLKIYLDRITGSTTHSLFEGTNDWEEDDMFMLAQTTLKYSGKL